MTTAAFRTELNKAQVILTRLRKMCDGAPFTKTRPRNHSKPTAEMAFDHAVIIKAVAHEFGVDESKFNGHSRTEPLATARFVAVYLFHCKHHPSLATTGSLFNRDYGTVHYAIKAIKDRMDTEPAFSVRVERLKGVVK